MVGGVGLRCYEIRRAGVRRSEARRDEDGVRVIMRMRK